MAAKGEQVIIRRGKSESFTVTPISDDDLYFTPEMLKKLDRSIQQAKEGKVKTLRSEEDIKKFLGLL